MSQFRSELAQSLAPNILGLTLLPTEQCCFRCTYCYEDFDIGKMPKSVQDGILKLAEQRAPELDLLKVSWFGGEPLMAKDIVYNLSEQLIALSQLHDFTYTASMTTNAYLLDRECYERLVALGVTRYQITLDGPQAIHDDVRKRVDGKGTFQVIWNNLLAIKASAAQADIILRVHYKPDTWKAVLGLLDDLKQQLLDDERFKVIFRAVGHWGGENDESYDVFDEDADKSRVERQLVERLWGEIPEGVTSNDEFYVCYAAKANHLVVRANGSLAKCTVALSHPNNDVGHITAEGELVIHENRYKKWLIGFQTGNIEQLSCPASSALKEVVQVSTLRNIPIIASQVA